MNLIEYQKINNSFSKRLVFHLGTGSGFFSEYNNMLKAMAYCLQNQIQFILYSADASFAFNKGWQDFFQSFCTEVVDDLHSKYNKRFLKRSITRSFGRYLRGILVSIKYRKTYGHMLQYSKFYRESNDIQQIKKKFHFDYFTYDLWSSIQEMSLSKTIKIGKVFEGDIFSLMQHIDRLIWNFNEDTKTEIEQLINSLKLPTDFFGMQIRGGDKFLENNILDYKHYVEALIKKTQNNCPTNVVFILTDDFRIIDKIKESYSQFVVHTFCTIYEKGYYNSSFKEQTEMERKTKIIRLLASIEVLSKSKYFIGTESANPGKYLKLRLGDSKFFSLD